MSERRTERDYPFTSERYGWDWRSRPGNRVVGYWDHRAGGAMDDWRDSSQPRYSEGRDPRERIPDWEHHPWYPGHEQHDHPHRGLLGRMFEGLKPHRGPKNYTRSDERIREEICERLIYSDSIECADVSIEVRDGVATLDGTVPDRRMRHAIEDLVERSYGVKDIDNRIRVNRPVVDEYPED